ncbi:MAG: hypothetical protein U9R32_07635 [Bacteroidota bacterium]|nr:hypothetical protein [Bacteroidota bacterium]
MNSKYILSFLFLIIAAMPLQAQKKSSYIHPQQVKSGIGITFTGTGDMMGTSLFTEYHYFLNNYASLSSALSFKFFKDDSDGLLINEHMKDVELGAYLHPLHGDDFSFFFGGGVMLREFYFSVATDPVTNYQFDDTYVPTASSYSTTQYGIGYSVCAGFSFKLKQDIDFTFQEKLQNDTNGNITWDSQIGVIFSF